MWTPPINKSAELTQGALKLIHFTLRVSVAPVPGHRLPPAARRGWREGWPPPRPRSQTSSAGWMSAAEWKSPAGGSVPRRSCKTGGWHVVRLQKAKTTGSNRSRHWPEAEAGTGRQRHVCPIEEQWLKLKLLKSTFLKLLFGLENSLTWLGSWYPWSRPGEGKRRRRCAWGQESWTKKVSLMIAFSASPI
jgi:hypothetical protein